MYDFYKPLADNSIKKSSIKKYKKINHSSNYLNNFSDYRVGKPFT